MLLHACMNYDLFCVVLLQSVMCESCVSMCIELSLYFVELLYTLCALHCFSSIESIFAVSERYWDKGLPSKYIVKAVNSFAVPVLLYGFGVVNWSCQELRDLDIILRKMLKQCSCHHPCASVDRLYIPRRLGGRGFVSLMQLHDQRSVSSTRYMSSNTKPLVQALFSFHQEVLPSSHSMAQSSCSS